MSIARIPLRTALLLALLLATLGVAYLSGLGDVGLLGPDETRYASIGREMASSGDWISPRLWGAPWYEKPPLIYWMTAAGFLAGLGPDLAPRVPVAIASLLFLAWMFLVLRRLEGEAVAWISTVILATSAGWVTYSQIGVTDLPLSVTFAVALLLGLLWLESNSRVTLAWAGFFFGLAVLAKGLVPLVLVTPFLWFARQRWKELLIPAAVAAAVALPWNLLMLSRHGWPFVDELYVRHHFARITSDSLMHQQPFWFYVPVVIGALFPWPAVFATLRPSCFTSPRLRIFAATFGFGFVFFSAATNKLPGYVLPLMPALCIVLAAGVANAARACRPLALSALLVGLCPVIAAILPNALLVGLRRTPMGEAPWEFLALMLPPAAVVYLLDIKGKRLAACTTVGVLAAAGFLFIKLSAGPALDEVVSARGLWRRVRPVAAETCVQSLNRNWRYGLNYYSVTPLPDCDASHARYVIRQGAGEMPRRELRAN